MEHHRQGEEKGLNGLHRVVARSLVAALACAIVILTLMPAEDWTGSKDLVWCIACAQKSLRDAGGNLLLFAPFGGGVALAGGSLLRALSTAGLLSLAVELTQFLVPGRDPNAGDLLFNLCGTLGGYLLLRTGIGTRFGDAVLRALAALAAPGGRASTWLAAGAALLVAAAVAVTAVLLTPAFSPGTYYGRSKSLQPTTSALRLGGFADPADNFEGLLDEVRVYDRALSAAEIQADMGQPLRPGSRQQPGVDRAMSLSGAYAFHEGRGVDVHDSSLHGNAGRISGAAWAPGRFDTALRFDGADDFVLIPHHPSLDLTSEMTLEAWVHPMSRQRRWGHVVEKEGYGYFLSASSLAGFLRPAAGGTFGSEAESLTAPVEIRENDWTHLAATYDGSMLRLYINGSQVAAKPRWIRGRVLAASVGGVDLRAGSNPDSAGLRNNLLAGEPMVISVIPGPADDRLVPLLDLHDSDGASLAFVGIERDDVVLRLRTRAAALGLHTPVFRYPRALRDAPRESPARFILSQHGKERCLDVGEISQCRPGYSVGLGWATFILSEPLSPWTQEIISAVWIGALSFVPGFWARSRSVVWCGVLIVAAALLAIPPLTGLAPTPALQLAGAAGGFVSGRRFQRVFRAQWR